MGVLARYITDRPLPLDVDGGVSPVSTYGVLKLVGAVCPPPIALEGVALNVAFHATAWIEMEHVPRGRSPGASLVWCECDEKK